MKMLLSPIISVMRRLRLVPKFALVSAAFVAPLLLLLSMLYAELHRTIEVAERERSGVRHVRLLEELTQQVQKHRALRHMQLGGNASAGTASVPVREAVSTKLSELDVVAEKDSKFDIAAPLAEIRQLWQKVEQGLPAAKAKESQADHTALIERVLKLASQISDKSGLTMDPELDSYHLAAALVQSLPGIADTLSQIAGRGAAYIDTGLLEPNEDLLLSSSVMVARQDLARVPLQFAAAFRENPGLEPLLAPQLASIPAALAFLDRARDEVLNSYNQTSGNQFFEAGSKNIDALHAAAYATGDALDGLLEQRIQRYSARLHLILAAVLGSLAIAAYLLTGFYVSFSRDIEQLGHAVERAAAGDLSSRVSSSTRDEIGDLVNAVAAMNGGLAQLVEQVRQGSEIVARTSHEITADNSDLSTRTASQASALQQTTASMEKLTSIARQNNENAAQASQLVASATDLALKGGQAVGRVVDTMGAIKQSSCRIIDIIGVIDSIAFQTNMLALNAAVEAARAGQQGRGFAVVAAEVRALAHRSADAAKEIKALIDNSVAQIDTGHTLADAAGRTMQDTMNSVQHVARIMHDISIASNEQTTGIEQVNQALGHMDEVTQRNASLVEHAAQATEALEAQAAQLSEAVAVFKIGPAVAGDDTATPWHEPAQEAVAAALPLGQARRLHIVHAMNDGGARDAYALRKIA